jgi:hypothetical protein
VSLQDQLFDNLTLSDWQAVLDPKLTGTWNLHHQLSSDLDFFVILSSLGGMIGSRGQSQYTAVAAFQDAFARYRHARGQPCISLDIGLVTSVGYVAEQEDIAQRWVRAGFEVLREDELHAIVDWACHPDRYTSFSSSPWATQVLTALDRPATALAHNKPLQPYMSRPMYRHLHQMGDPSSPSSSSSSPSSSSTEKQPNYGTQLRAAASLPEAGRIVASALAHRLSQALSVPQEDIDTARPAHSFGVDSLVAVELRFWFAREIQTELGVFNILANVSIEELGVQAAEKSKFCEHLE